MVSAFDVWEIKMVAAASTKEATVARSTPARVPRLAPVMTCPSYTSDAADDMQCVDLGGRRIC